MVDVEQVLNLIETNDKIPEVENPVPVNIKEATIEFKDVEFTYDIKLPNEEQRTVFKKVNFTVPAGKSVGIVGQTGSGKSTIMRLLYRFYDVTGGKILIDGQDISQMALSELRSQIAIVP
jgi:ABC-type multidrug transport system fused ATPase/permease subunit